MKWINGYTKAMKRYQREEKKSVKLKAINSWHRWFAWRPVCVKITDERRQVKVWLEWVERSGIQHYDLIGKFWVWEYREKQ